MKTNQLYLLASLLLALLITLPNAARAQVKIGNNYTAIGSNSNLEVESATNSAYKTIVDKNGKVIIQDGTQGAGRVLTSDANGVSSWAAPAAQTSPVQTQLMLGGDQSLPINNNSNTTPLNTTVVSFDVGGNASGNSVVIPSNGLYDISGSIVFGTTGLSSGSFGWSFRMLKNGLGVKEFDGGVIISGANQAGQGRTVARLVAGDVLGAGFITQQTAGTMTAKGVEFTVIKLSN